MKFVDPLQGVSDLIKVSLDGRCRALALIVFEGWRSGANAPVAFVSEQAGWGSPALMPIVPVGGFEVKVKHVLLQPATQTANSSVTRREGFKQLEQRDRAFLAKVRLIRYLWKGNRSQR